MTVFFDHQAFCMQEYGGVSRYFTKLIAGLQQSSDVTPVLPLRYTNNRHLQDAGLHHRLFFPNHTFRGKQRLLYGLNRWNDIAHIRAEPFDVFHATYYDPYFLPHLNSLSRKVPLVMTFSDMIYEKLGHQFPELAQDKAIVKHKRLLASRAHKLIAVSESTKRDMVEILNVDPDKIVVIYHGSSFAPVASLKNEDESTPGDAPYLLYVGLRRGYKNFDGMLRAIAPLLKRDAIQLICAGGEAFTVAECQFIDSLGVRKHVVQRDFTDYQLQQLYQNAVAFVFPSLYEGFGIPILEAMANGCPCILSNRGSLPEIGGDAALYFDPVTGMDEFLEVIKSILADNELRHQLVQKGFNRETAFSWKLASEQTVKLYESIT